MQEMGRTEEERGWDFVCFLFFCAENTMGERNMGRS